MAQNTSFETSTTLKERYGIKEQQQMMTEADILPSFFYFYSAYFDPAKDAIDIS